MIKMKIIELENKFITIYMTKALFTAHTIQSYHTRGTLLFHFFILVDHGLEILNAQGTFYVI